MHRAQFERALSIFTGIGFFLCICGSSRVPANNLIYTYANYPALQNGYTLTGTIVTDGTIGVLPYSSILSASVTVTNGTTTYTLPSANDVFGTNQLVATPTQLLLPPSSTSSVPNLSIGSTGYETPQLQYDYQVSNGNYSSDWFCTVDHPTTLTIVWQDTNNPFQLHGESLIIANAVPEPASVTLLALGAAMIFARLKCRRSTASSLIA